MRYQVVQTEDGSRWCILRGWKAVDPEKFYDTKEEAEAVMENLRKEELGKYIREMAKRFRDFRGDTD